MTALILPRRLRNQPQGDAALAPEWVRDTRSLVWLPQSPRSTSTSLSSGEWKGPHSLGINQDGVVVSFDGTQYLRKQAETLGSATFGAPLILVVRCAATSTAAGESYPLSVGAYSRVNDLCRVGRNGTALRAQFRNTGGAALNVDVTGAAQIGKVVTWVARFAPAGGDLLFYQDGTLLNSGVMPASGTLNAQAFSVGSGHPADSIQKWIGSVSMAGFLIGDYTDAEARSLSQNPYQLFRPVTRRIYFDLGAVSGGVTGSLNAAEADDSISTTGSSSVIGSAVSSETLDSLASAGASPITSALSQPETADSAAITGSPVVAGAAAITEAPDSVAATGALPLSASSSITESSDQIASAGSVAVSGQATQAEQADALATTCSTTIIGTGAVVEASDGITATVSTGEAVASLSVTDAGDTFSSAGSTLISATCQITESSDLIASTGSTLASAQATLAEGDDALVTLCSTTVVGVVAVLEASDALSSAASFGAAHADLSIAEAGDSILASGQVTVGAALSSTEADDVPGAVGSVKVAAAVSVAEGDDSAACSGQVSINASATIQESTDTLQTSGDSALPIASASITEADDVLAALVGVEVLGYGVLTEDGDRLQAGDPQEQQSQVYGHGKRKEDVDPELVREQWDLLELRRRNEQQAHQESRKEQKIQEVATASTADAPTPQLVLQTDDDLDAAEIAKIAWAVLEFLR